jgi:hypothetical protein
MTIVEFLGGVYGDLGQTLALTSTLALTLLALYPIVMFLWSGWGVKRDDIFNTFSTDAMKRYLDVYQKNTVVKSVKEKPAQAQSPHETAISTQGTFTAAKNDGKTPTQTSTGNPTAIALSAKQVKDKFSAIYNRNFGRWRFAFPVLLFFVTCVAGVFLSVEWALSRITVIKPGLVAVLTQHGGVYVALPALGAIAELGAYVWIVSDLFTRSQRQSMQPIDVLNGTLRLAMAGPIGYAFAAIGGGTGHLLGPVLAFAAGAFPLATVRVMLRSFATKQLGVPIGIENDQDQVIELNSIDQPTADMLLDSGISTVAQLAYCDPVRLCMRTGLTFDYVVDIVSEALAWLYFEDKLDTLRPAGLRGAIEISNLLKAANGDPSQAETRRAVALCDVAAQMVNLSTPAFLNACDEAAGDSATELLLALWQET